MSVKLETPDGPQGIPVADMTDGQIGVIVAWSGDDFAGQVVQRYGSHLVRLGSPSGNGWPTVLASRNLVCRVRLLEPGERITIVRN